MKPQILSEPMMKQEDRWLTAWIISCVFLGVIACAVLPDFGNPIQNRERTQRNSVRQMRSARVVSMRRKAA